MRFGFPSVLLFLALRVFADDSSDARSLTGAVATPNVPPSPRVITGATLIDGLGGAPVVNANVIVREGKIECAGAECPVPAGIDVVDARGMWVTPGLVDAHVHFSQTGWFDGRPDAFDVRAAYPYDKTIASLKTTPERFARSYLCSGVTAVFDVGGYPWTLQLAERFAKNMQTPHVAAAGPLLSTLDHWLNLPAERQFIHLKDDTARGGVQYLAAQGAKAIKVWAIVTPELPVEKSESAMAAAADEARKAGLPLIVHATGLAEAKAALRAGAKLLVHSVSEEPIDEEFIALMKKNGTALTPTLTVSRGYVRGAEAVASRVAPVVDDPNKCVDTATMARVAATAALDASLVSPDRAKRRRARLTESDRISFANLKRLSDAGVAIATGTDAGNPLTLHGPAIYDEMDAMQRAGMTPMQVIVASTSAAARVAGLLEVTGTLEKGKDADLVLLAADPTKDVANFRRVRFVMRGGVLRGIDELSAMAK